MIQPPNAAAFQESIRRHIRYSLGKDWQDLFTALALVVRDRMVDGMLATEARRQKADAKRLYYLSLEFLMGRSLGNNLANLGLLDSSAQALQEIGIDLDEVCESEYDAALGNGGLGRLAACFLDSLATLEMPGYGYGINYEYGLFRQEIRDGYQQERPDNWQVYQTPWEIERPDEACIIPLYGRIEHGVDRHGNYNPMWMDWNHIVGVPHDMPIVGYGGRAVNYLRLYSARSSHEFDMQIFNEGDYFKAVEQKIANETISKVLYPSDMIASGRELRLIQEYFLIACALRDIVRRYRQAHETFDVFPDRVAVQLNDTHPENWVALTAFFITASAVGHLSARVKQRAGEAEASREEARHASAYNRSLIEASLDPLVTIGPDGKIADVNAATEVATGHSRAELLGTDFANYFTEPAKARTGYQQAFRQGFVRDYALELQHRDGHVTSVLYNASVYRDESGNVSGVFAAARDITERKRSEEQLLRINRAHRALSTCNQTLIRATDESSWLDEICRIIVEEAGYRFCWVGYAEQEDPKAVRPLAHAGFEEGYLQTLNITWADTERGHGPTGTCIRTGETQFTRNTATDPRMGPWRMEALKRGYASSIAIPLFVDAKPFGALTIYASETEAFGSEEVKLLSELAGDLGYGISVIRTRAERIQALEEIRALNSELEARVSVRTAELQHANQELEQAREREGEIGFRIQQTLLLDQPPRDIPSLRVAALTIPSQRIGGDFYIFLRHSEECLDVIVGDVMGKGIPGALLGAATKSHILRALSDLMALSKNGILPEPKEIVTLAHSELVRRLIELESFVTLCYARLDVKRHSLTCVDCGHTGILQLHRKTGISEILHGDNLPLGFREGEIYDQTSVPLDPGDLLLFFSDGITEARNTEEEFFGVERLEESFRRNGHLEPEALVLAVDEAVSNIIKHAYRGRPDQRIHLEAEAFSGRLSIRLHHLGDPVDLSKVPPPALDGSRESGFGIFIISRCVDEVRYYRDERGRNCVDIVKNWNP